MLGEVVSPLFSFLTEGTKAQGRPLGVGLGWPKGGATVNVLLLTLLMQSILVLKCREVFHPHPHILEFSWWCLVPD